MTNPFEAALEASAKMSITMAAKMTGMEPEQVAGMLAEGLPQAMEAAKASPEQAAAVFRDSFEAMPEPLQGVYEKMCAAAVAQGAAAVAQGATAADFTKMFGAQAKVLEQAAAEMAGTTTDKAGAVFGAAVPAMKDAMRQGAAAAGQAANAVEPAKAQELLGQTAQATAAVFGKLAGR